MAKPFLRNFFALLVMTMVLSACGQTGDLYLPEGLAWLISWGV